MGWSRRRNHLGPAGWAYDLDRDTWEQMQPKRTPPYREFGKVAYDTVDAWSIGS